MCSDHENDGRWSKGRGAGLDVSGASRSGHSANAELEHVRRIIHARRSRASYFDPQLFADPAWDILLQAYAGALAQQRQNITGLCAAAGVPATTAARWIQKLEDDGLLIRQINPLDARRIWVELTPKASAAMAACLSAAPYASWL